MRCGILRRDERRYGIVDEIVDEMEVDEIEVDDDLDKKK